MQAAAFVGAKIWNSDIWPFLVNWLCTAERIRWEFALCNYTPVLFVTVHTSAIVVAIIKSLVWKHFVDVSVF